MSSDVPSTLRTISLSTKAPIAIAASKVRNSAGQKPIAVSIADQAMKVVNIAIWP